MEGRRIVIAATMAASLAAGILASSAPAEPGGSTPSPDPYVVVYEDGIERPGAKTAERASELGFEVGQLYRKALEGFSAELDREQVRALREDPEVVRVEPDLPVSAETWGTPQPLAAGEPVPPPGIRRIGAATETTVREGSHVAVGVLDTGVDAAHPDLNVVHAHNCTDGGSPTRDPDGHGTHVAGTIAAENDGGGASGVAPGTPIVSVKVLGDDGQGRWSDVICGIDWATAKAEEHGIGVLNLSLGGNAPASEPCATTPQALHRAICRSTEAGIHFVVAAGNQRRGFDGGSPRVPAQYPEVLTVTAITDTDGLPGGEGSPCHVGDHGRVDDDKVAPFSNWATSGTGAAHVVAAPGVCVQSVAAGGETATLSGTSMAAPHVAGAVALCLDQGGAGGPCEEMSPSELIDHFVETAAARTAAEPRYGFAEDPLHTARPDRHYGFLLDASATPLASEQPRARILSRPERLGRQHSPSFEFTSSVEDSTFECRIGGGPYAPCSDPTGRHEVSEPLPDGHHVFAVRPIAPSGTVGTRAARASFTVDTTPPTTDIAGGPVGLTNEQRPRFIYHADEASVSFRCRIDEQPFGPCGPWFRPPTLPEGPHRFEVFAIDRAGNVELEPRGRSFTVDSVPPVTTITTTLPTKVGDRRPRIEFASNEPDSTFRCRLELGEPYESCSGPGDSHIPAEPLADGKYTFEVVARDQAGNSDPRPPRVTFWIEGPAPETFVLAAPPEATNDTRPAFEFGADGDDVRFECALGSSFGACSGPGSTHRPAEPLSDGWHTFRVRAIGADGFADPTPATHRFRVDTEPPQTSITAPQSPTGSREPQWELRSESGSTFECRIDGAPFAPCTGSRSHRGSALADGTRTLEVRATDPAGNVELPPYPRSDVVVDATPPETRIDSGPGDETIERRPTFGFSASRENARFQCALNGQSFVSCSGPGASHQPAYPLGFGTNVFRVRAISSTGVVDPTPASRTFEVVPDSNNPGPVARLTSVPPQFSAAAIVEFAFASDEAGTSFQCRFGGQPFSLCGARTGRHTSVRLADGLHTFEVRALAPDGRSSATPDSYTFVVDTERPVVSVTGGPQGVTSSRRPSFQLSASEPHVQLRCTIVGTVVRRSELCASPYTVPLALADGWYALQVTATDRAGNVSEQEALRYFIVDTVAPQVHFHGIGKKRRPRNTTFRFGSFDADTVGFLCSLNRAPFSSCSSPLRLRGLGRGLHLLRVKAVDAAGNRSPRATGFAFRVGKAKQPRRR